MAFSTAEQHKVAVDWSVITAAAIAEGCNIQRANHNDWHTDLSAQDLTKYLEMSTEDRWWIPSALRVAVEAILKANEAPLDDDCMVNFLIQWYLLSKCFQLQWQRHNHRQNPLPLPLHAVRLLNKRGKHLHIPFLRPLQPRLRKLESVQHLNRRIRSTMFPRLITLPQPCVECLRTFLWWKSSFDVHRARHLHRARCPRCLWSRWTQHRHRERSAKSLVTRRGAR